MKEMEAGGSRTSEEALAGGVGEEAGATSGRKEGV